jgi:MtN3 and saliva related transmembrane protein
VAPTDWGKKKVNCKSLKMGIINLVGAAGGIVSSVTFLPQVIKIWKTKSAKDLSMGTLLFLVLNVSLWLLYGILTNLYPIIITNGIVLSMVFIMVYFKLTFKEQ